MRVSPLWRAISVRAVVAQFDNAGGGWQARFINRAGKPGLEGGSTMSTTEMRRARGMKAELGGATEVRWTHVAPTLLIIWIVMTVDKGNMSIVQNNQAFLDELGLNGQQARIGLLSTGLILAFGFSAPIWGWVVNRIGARRTAALSLIIWGLTCFWSGLASNYGSLLSSRIFLGFGEGATYSCTYALVAHWFALKERGRATALWWIGTMIAPMFTGLVVTFLIVNFGWRAQFHALGVLALILPLPMLWFLVRDRPAEHPAANAAETGLVEAGSLENNEDAPGRVARAESRPWFSNIRFWLVTIAISANNIMYWGWAIWLPTYLRTARGFSFSGSGYLTFVIFGFAVATILIIGQLSDKIFRRAPLAAVGWIFAAAFLMGSALAPSPMWSVVLSICALCSQQVGISCVEMLMHSVVSEKEMGMSQGVRVMVSQLTGALSPLMIGVILQVTGGFVGAFVVLSLAIVIAAACMIKLAREGY
jgi:sugar phosphate permease